MRIRSAPNRVKYPNITVMLPTSSKTMAPKRKKVVLDIPNLAMYWAVSSKFPIFPIPELRKIKIRRILPIKLIKAFSLSKSNINERRDAIISVTYVRGLLKNYGGANGVQSGLLLERRMG